MFCFVFAVTFFSKTFADIELFSPNQWSKNWTFNDVIEKYEPSTIWEKIDKLQNSGRNLTTKDVNKIFLDGVDPTDEVLNLRVENGDAKLLFERSGRRWSPPGKVVNTPKDTFSVRHRTVELMKQAIYQTRNKMVIMQTLREKYRSKALYKMGFLFAKTDWAVKTFSGVAFKAFRACSMKRQSKYYVRRVALPFMDIIYMQERLMHLWFDIDLLIDILNTNHQIAKDKVLKFHSEGMKAEFDKQFQD